MMLGLHAQPPRGPDITKGQVVVSLSTGLPMPWSWGEVWRGSSTGRQGLETIQPEPWPKTTGDTKASVSSCWILGARMPSSFRRQVKHLAEHSH